MSREYSPNSMLSFIRFVLAAYSKKEWITERQEKGQNHALWKKKMNYWFQKDDEEIILRSFCFSRKQKWIFHTQDSQWDDLAIFW